MTKSFYENILFVGAIFCLMMVQIAFSQTITLNFTGATNHREYVQLDSVRVENINRSWEETLLYPDTILMLIDETGIDEIANNASSCISYPNPFNGTSRIELTLPQEEQLSLRVYNLVGQLVMEKHLQVEAGKSHFEIGLTHPQVYFLVAQTTHGQMVQKLINTGSSGGNDITYKGTFSETAPVKTQKLLSSKQFHIGDVLKITGFTTHYGMAVPSDEILQSQSESEKITLFFTLQNYTLPTLTTIVASQITDTSAVSGGIITDDGGIMITTCGVCWDTIPNPTISGSHTIDSSGMGSFSSHLTGLTTGTTYYVRAYASNAVGTAYGNSITFATCTIPAVTTIEISNITDTSAVSGGLITDDGGAMIIACGVCWDTIPNPTISNNHTTDGLDTGSFTSHLTGLTIGTTYYVRAYATNSVGVSYGNQIVFTLALSKSFSVSVGTYVYFSPGNLQWSATNGGETPTTHTVSGGGTAAGTWRFAPNQWDTIGADNSNISSSYTGWIDLFGWGTSGYDNKYPYMTSTTDTDYVNGNNNISGTNYDWGVYNAIYNPTTQNTDAPGTWRTLTKDEWEYLLVTRTTPSGIRYAKAIVNGVNGLIIVPDNWTTSIYSLNNTNNPNAAYTSNTINTINATDWVKMENSGCVFLPATGNRLGNSVNDINLNGLYWSSTNNGSNYPYGLYFTSSVFYPFNFDYIYSGESVRLVRSVNTPIAPIIRTTSISNITDTTAEIGGDITDNGGSMVTACGVCWDTTPNPTINGSHTIEGVTMGKFTSHLKGLIASKTYYVRAYATNAVGTAYGNEVTFIASSPFYAPISVSTTRKVIFSPGNLQWSATNGGNTATTHMVADSGIAAGTWRFAPHQWDTIGADNSNISSSYTGWIDLFGWGTSGYDNKYPYMTSSDASDYINAYGDISVTNYDWGVYNAIYNPRTNTTDVPGTWRSLTYNELHYLLHTRPTTSGIRYVKAVVNGIEGLVIVPDNWNIATYTLHDTNSAAISYTSNRIDSSDWIKMEAVGCVFLPVSGYRFGTSVYNNVNREGYYWSASNVVVYNAISVYFNSNNTRLLTSTSPRIQGSSVRLARSADIVISTIAPSDITETSAEVGGNIAEEGSSAVIERGVCWSLSQDPTIYDNHTSDSCGRGSFTSHIIGLTAGTTYYVRAYAINSFDTVYGNQIKFTTLNPSKSFSVSADKFVYFSPGNLQWSATNGGNTATTHSVADSGTAAGTWRFAPNQWDTIGADNSNISSSYTGWIDLFGWGTSGYNNKYPYMTSSDSVYGNGNNPIAGTNYDWGVYNAIYNPTTQNTDDPGTWRTLTKDEWVYLLNNRQTSSNIRYAKAIVNGVSGLIIVPDNWMMSVYSLNNTNSSSAAYTSNTIDSANWAKMEDAGCVFLPAAGFRNGTSVNDISMLGNYWSTNSFNREAFYLYFNSSYLDPSYNYYQYYGRSVRLVRYANIIAPIITTTAISNITDTSAVSGGNIVDNGVIPITACGICWSTTQNPTIYDNHTSDGSSMGSFTSRLTGLTAGTTYYVRAYANSTVGTMYGNEVSFTTHTLPVVITDTASIIGITSAVIEGNIINDGDTMITARGVCWDTTPHPTINGSHTIDGSDTGSYTSILTGLTAETTYYARAYATNAVGTAYGNEFSFTTVDKFVFSVSDTNSVIFSPGNLQWSATNGGNTATTHAVADSGTAAGTWRFSPHQWDTIRAGNENISSTYTGWIDLFGWGTSGYNNKYPYMTTTTDTNYGNGANDISGTGYDWGIYNAIYNPSTNTTDAPGTWRTLTGNELFYLFYKRTILDSTLTWTRAIVNGVNGLIIVPDNWTSAIYPSNAYNRSIDDSNVFNSTDWTKLEVAGCVFLPTVGYREGNTCPFLYSESNYWSANADDEINLAGAWSLHTYTSPLPCLTPRCRGYSVRLVKDVEKK